MEFPINPDPQDLNKSVFRGRKWWQYMCIILAFVIVVGFTFVFGTKISGSMNGILCAVMVVPMGYVGLFKKNGLDFFEYYRMKQENRNGNNTFVYVSAPVTGKKEHESRKTVTQERRSK